MGHQNIVQVKKISKNSSVNINNQKILNCEDCIMGKMHRLPFPKSESECKQAGELVHADLCGPMQEASMKGSRYFLLIKDDYTCWRKVYFLKHKSETTDCLEDFFKKTEKHLEVLKLSERITVLNSSIRKSKS